MGRLSSYFVCDTFILSYLILSYLIYERWSPSVCFTLSAFHDQSQSAAKEVEIIVFPFLSFWILLYLYFCHNSRLRYLLMNTIDLHFNFNLKSRCGFQNIINSTDKQLWDQKRNTSSANFDNVF